MRFLATTVLLLASVGSALAFSQSPLSLDARPPVILVSGGCGIAFHRNPYGFCVPNRPFLGGPVRLPPPCPRFYHRDPDPARPLCYPNI